MLPVSLSRMAPSPVSLDALRDDATMAGSAHRGSRTVAYLSPKALPARSPSFQTAFGEWTSNGPTMFGEPAPMIMFWADTPFGRPESIVFGPVPWGRVSIWSTVLAPRM